MDASAGDDELRGGGRRAGGAPKEFCANEAVGVPGSVKLADNGESEDPLEMREVDTDEAEAWCGSNSPALDRMWGWSAGGGVGGILDGGCGSGEALL